MGVTATEVFEWLEGVDDISVERVEVASTTFGELRHNLRSIICTLRESDDLRTIEVCDELRVAVSGWLTSPITFDSTFRDTLGVLGDAGEVEARWGRDVRVWYESALRAADSIAECENPLTKELRSRIHFEQEHGHDFRIYCNKWARMHFEGLLASPGNEEIDESQFLHSVKDYRESKPFDVLLKVGPLRSRGWGALPDAILTAPRYAKLVQFVWVGCADDMEFGYDPVGATTTTGARGETVSPGQKLLRTHRYVGSTVDERRSLHVGYTPDDDELRLFSSPRPNQERWRASILVQIDEEHGILYPRLAKVLSFNPSPDSSDPLKRRVPGETLVEGTFLVRPILEDVDFGELHASHGYYSRIWKRKLMEEFLEDADGLIKRLTAGGLDLLRLRNAVQNWLKPPTTVIHAPQQRRHFKSLIETLDADIAWERAWSEVQRSRGVAIRTGVQEQEIVENELLIILGELLDSIRALAEPGESFSLSIPEGKELQGSVLLDAVQSVEDGFYVPEGDLKQVVELSKCEQWRA